MLRVRVLGVAAAKAKRVVGRLAPSDERLTTVLVTHCANPPKSSVRDRYALIKQYGRTLIGT
eukprot:317092-Prymnesium_polylepis.1